MRGSPVREFSGNKRLHFIHQATSSPGDVAFSFITPVNLNHQ
ncbi:putative cytoplasmic protein [Escherichia coli 1-110-08_S3_C2]|nr:putative cytoplasmic protein [Escherichia coli 1-110-08_S3_C3]EYE15144.1 putative cytoplasmic protein [Escherichia coli 1-110-08_S3_C2]